MVLVYRARGVRRSRRRDLAVGGQLQPGVFLDFKNVAIIFNFVVRAIPFRSAEQYCVVCVYYRLVNGLFVVLLTQCHGMTKS